MSAAGAHVVFGSGPAGPEVGGVEADIDGLGAVRHRWAEEFPPLQRAVLGAAKSADAKLVVLEILYMYGPSTRPLRETAAVDPTSAKSRTRAAMSAELLDAHQRGEVRVVIGRASDFVGPGLGDSALGEFVVQPTLAGKRAQTMGRPDTEHTYYQFAAPFVVDDSAFRDAFGAHTTHWGDIVASTVEWYRAHATQPEFSTGLAEATTLKVAA